MSSTQIRVTLDRSDNERLGIEAGRRGIPSATLAASFVREGLDRAEAETQVRVPAAELKRWLEPFLDDLRRRGDWPADITIDVFDHIRDEARALYDAAVEDVGQSKLNRDIGRTIRDRLNAQVVTDGKKPKIKKVSRLRGSLIQAATLLAPKSGKQP